MKNFTFIQILIQQIKKKYHNQTEKFLFIFSQFCQNKYYPKNLFI